MSVCPPCRDNKHHDCPELARQRANPDLAETQRNGGLHCDCQHKTRKEGVPAGAVRVLENVEMVSFGPGAGMFPGAGLRSISNGAGMNVCNGPSAGVIVPMTHWWFDHDRWVGAL